MFGDDYRFVAPYAAEQMGLDNFTYGSSSMNPEIGATKSKSYEQLRIDISLCSYVIAPDAIAH